MRGKDNLRQRCGHLRRQLQRELYPGWLDAEDVHVRAPPFVDELQDAPDSHFVKGVSLTGSGKVITATVEEGARWLACVHRVNHQHADASLKEWKCAQKIGLSGQDYRLRRRFGLQDASSVNPYSVIR